METYVVICRDDAPAHPEGAVGNYVLATREVFASAEAAQHFADGVARSREPMVIAGDWLHLRVGPGSSAGPRAAVERMVAVEQTALAGALVLETDILQTFVRARDLLDKIFTWDGEDEALRKQTVEELASFVTAIAGLKPAAGRA